jgi:hypothetical protein
MRKSAAIILSATALVMFSDAAEARRLGISFRSVSRPVAPVSRPVAASNASSRGGTFVVIGTNRNNQNGPMAAAPRTPVPEPGPLHEIASAVDQTSPMPEKPVEQVAEQQPEPPAMQNTPVFISMAAPKPVPPPERRAAPAQPVRMVYCVVQAKGGCAPY